jgi:outer membrane lipoprotein-sorting protein
MKYIKPALLALLMAFTANVFAQDAQAKKILDELSNKTRKYPTITSDFTFTLDDDAADVHQTQEGMLKMKGKKYYVKLGDNQIYSDGETRWTYNEDMNEVYIDFADGDDDALNPSKIYTVWETGFKHYYEKEITKNGSPHHVIKLVPTDPDGKAFHTVKLFVDKSQMEVSEILIMGKQGENYTYNVESFETQNNYDSDTFVFSEKNHPGVTTIDNR